LLLTVNEIEELCHKYGLSYFIEGQDMFVSCVSFVFEPRKKDEFLYLRHVKGNCYRLKIVYSRMEHIFQNNNIRLGLIPKYYGNPEYKDLPHTISELELITKDVIEQIYEKENVLKTYAIEEKKIQMEADFDC